MSEIKRYSTADCVDTQSATNHFIHWAKYSDHEIALREAVEESEYRGKMLDEAIENNQRQAKKVYELEQQVAELSETGKRSVERRLEAENKVNELEGSNKSLFQNNHLLRNKIKTLESHIKKAMEDLGKYGMHEAYCPNDLSVEVKCTCGFDAALKGGV